MTMFGPTMAHYSSSSTLCGCWYLPAGSYSREYLPQIELHSHTTILATTSRTKLTQTFHNPLTKEKLNEAQYTFPLYDGVSVVSFRCKVAGRTIVGVVKEKQKAREDYQAAVDRGETAGLLEQVPEASDAFTTKIGNIPANEKVIVEIEYLGELKHDAETDGSRFTIPTIIAPRYGSTAADVEMSGGSRGISILVDIAVDETSIIRGVQSPSHPIALTMGRISTTADEDSFDNHHASATLTLGSAVLEKDFVVVVLAKGQDTPQALLETHSSILNQRALMTTLVPKFNLPSIKPEIVFVVDRSGSMGGKIPTLVAALKVFLKSLPVAVKFNICSFGSQHKFMFPKSKTYDQSTLEEALRHVASFAADFGGTEMHSAVEATFNNRLSGIPLEVLVLTDGQIWNQEELFRYITTFCANEPVRVFSLGIGSGASSSLVEGIARAGDGFAQFVDDNEKMDKRVVRMLKGAMSPHIKDYTLEVKYAKSVEDVDDDEFEIVDSVQEGITKLVIDAPKTPASSVRKTISLFDTSTKEEPTNPQAGRHAHLPNITPPAVLQAPHKFPTLYPFNRTTVYLLLGPHACQRMPTSVVLRATSQHGPLELDIPVQDVGVGQTIHQLAAKKAVLELEEGRGWLADRTIKKAFTNTEHECRMDEMAEREAVRLGVEYQVGGKFCSFVAVEDGVEREHLPEVKAAAIENEDGRLRRRTSGSHHSGGGSHSGGLFGSMMSSRASAGGLFAASSPVQYDKKVSHAGGAAQRMGFADMAQPPAPASGVRPALQMASTPLMYGASSAFGAPPSQDRLQPQPPGSSPKSARFRKSKFGFASAPGGPPAAEARRSGHRPTISPPAKMAPQATRLPSENGPDSMQVSRQSAFDPSPRELSSEEKVRALIDLNRFDGSWERNAQLKQIVGPDWEKIKHWGREGWSETARVTAIVIAFLEVKMTQEKEIWDMVVEKANEWLGANVGDAEGAIKQVKTLLE